jgi:ribosomal protein S18 acetylase RimI-like enzyme
MVYERQGDSRVVPQRPAAADGVGSAKIPAQLPLQRKIAARQPGPPAPAFAARPSTVQRHGAGGAFAVEAGRLGLASGGGSPLPESVRGKMEAALGADLSNVRVHVGPQADRIGAIAFTIGSDIYFAPGRYQPNTLQGQQLLGHELAHVVQQRAGRVRNPLSTVLAVVQDHALEAEADRIGQRAAAHRVVAQPKMRSEAALPSTLRISPPISTGPGRYRLTAGVGERQVGSVLVHARDKGAIEVTDLSVAQAQRSQGIGRQLVASAARTGLQLGRSKVTLVAQDNGSRHLMQWYKGMGFAEVGVNNRGFPQLEAPIGRVLAGMARGPARPGADDAVQRIHPAPYVRKNGNPLQATLTPRRQQLIQRMEMRLGAKDVSYRIKSGHQDFDDKTKDLVRAGAPSGMTMHHKISQANLKRLTRVLGEAANSSSQQVVQATAALLNTVYDYMLLIGISKKSAFELLNNMPLNLAYGPTDRWHHMGDLFDPNVDLSTAEGAQGDILPLSDISQKEPVVDKRPKLYRQLSARSFELSAVDRLIVAMPVGLGEIRTYVKTQRAAADISQINDALARSIAKDKEIVGREKELKVEEKKRFYDMRQWEVHADDEYKKYKRATTKSIFDTYDPAFGSATSIAVLNRNNRLEQLQRAWKYGSNKQPDEEIQRLIHACYGLIGSLSNKFSVSSIDEYYEDNIKYLQMIGELIAFKPKKLKIYGGKKKELDQEDPAVKDADFQIAEYKADIDFILGK